MGVTVFGGSDFGLQFSAESVAPVHWSVALLADNIAAPVELAATIFRLPFSLEAATTAEHITATSARCVGALTTSRSNRTRLSVC